MADSAPNLDIPQTDVTSVSDLSSLLDSGLGTSVSSSCVLVSPSHPVSVLGSVGTVSSAAVSSGAISSSGALSTGTVSSETVAINPVSLPLTETQGHRSLLLIPVFGLPTPCSSALDKVQPAVAFLEAPLDEPFPWPSRGLSRFGSTGHDASALSSSVIESVEHQDMTYGAQQLIQCDGPADDGSGMMDTPSIGQERQNQQQRPRAHSMQPLNPFPVSRETPTSAPLPGIGLLGDLSMVDKQGNEVAMASTQTQMSQIHSLRAEIQETEAQKVQSHLQRFHRGFQRGFQQPYSQQPVVTLPADFELAVARIFTSAGQQRQPALATIPESPSLFQRVLTGLNSAHGISQDESQILPHPGQQEPDSTIGRDYALTESEGYLDSGQHQQGLGLNGSFPWIDDRMDQQAPFNINSAGGPAFTSGHDTETGPQNSLSQNSILDLSTDLSNGMSTGLSSGRPLISPQDQGRRALPPRPVVHLPTYCSPTLAKGGPVVAFPLPPAVSTSTSAVLDLDDRVPLSPEDCKWRQGGQYEYNMASGGFLGAGISIDSGVPGVTRDSGFEQVASGDPLACLGRGDILDITSSSLNRNPKDSECHPDQTLGSIVVSSLMDNQVLFIFDMFDLMANLRARYEYKYGGKNGKKIGVRLTLWGHTVLIAPMTESLHEARVSACREALEQLRGFNMLWQIPPQPMDGPTSPSWNWVEVLEAYRMAQKWPKPRYLPIRDGRTWHCDVHVDKKVYRTMKPVPTLDEAQNTVAHLAIHQIMVGRGYDHFSILPANKSVMVSVPTQKQIASLLHSKNADAPKNTGTTVQYAGVTKSAVLPKSRRSRGRGGRSGSQSQNDAQQNTQVRSNVPTADKAKNGNCSALIPAKVNSNMIPVTDSRFVPIKVQEEPANDPLATLRSIAKVLGELDKDASFMSVVRMICDALHASAPQMVVNMVPKKLNKLANAYAVLAWVHGANPYLNRASPIHLAYVVSKDKEAAKAIGVKKLILYILKMAKEDAGIEDAEYPNGFGVLQALEDECEQSLSTYKTQGKFFLL